ncbi:hypothetical protein ACTD5D_36830 [Nocardia takedensis]|uniref:hypothetical protein n=1 Tax=Nocardia takedensis TaxID=259390 RepID=UPI000307E3F8|nr:hypothetical protein [Nocardia takedensis]
MSVTRTLVFAALTAASLTVVGAQAAHAAGDEYGAIAVEKAVGTPGLIPLPAAVGYVLCTPNSQ